MRLAPAGKIAFWAIVAGIAGIIMPNPALSTTLSLVSGVSMEVAKFNPPNLPFTYNPDNPDISVEGAIAWILSEGFGVSTQSIYGPGVTSWENGAEAYDNAIIAKASAVGTVAKFLDPLILGDTQYVKDTWFYAAIYELTGDTGGSANISLDYTLMYTYYNIAYLGRSKSDVAADFHSWIIPADKTWKYGDSAVNNWFYPGGNGPYPIDAKQWGEGFTYENDVEYYVISGFEDINRAKSGSLNLGSMNVGDRLYLWGALGAYTECELGWLTGLTTATSFTSFEGYFNVEDTSAVPEPTSFLLLGTGLGVIGLAAWRRKK